MEGNLQIVGRDIRRLNEVEACGGRGTKFGIVPQFPGEIHVTGVKRLAISPGDTWADLKGPGFEVGD